MEIKTSYLEPLFERAEEYGKTSYELIKLRTLEKTSKILSAIISRGIVVLILAIFIVFANIGLALWLGDLLGKNYYGFLCVAGLYGIVWGVLHFFLHNQIKRKINNSLITQMFN
jgi:cytochrome c biogenesis protein CcdA